MSRIECKWGRAKDFSHLHSIRLMWSTASGLGLMIFSMKMICSRFTAEWLENKRVFAPVDKYRKCCGLVLWSDWTRPRHNSMIDIRVVILGVPLLFREILKCLWYLFAKFRETWWLCINYLIQNALWRIKSFFFYFLPKYYFPYFVLLLGLVPVYNLL